MTTWLCEVTRESVESGECIECARRCLVPECAWSSPGLLMRLKKELEKKSDVPSGTVRVSYLVQCPRKSWYQMREPAPLESPSEHWARLRGTMFHEGFEHGLPGEEVRLKWEVETSNGPVVVTGRYDYYDAENHTLHDYKTANEIGPGIALPKKNNVMQMGLYVWLLSKHGEMVERINLTYLSMRRVLAVWLDRTDVPEYTDEDVRRMVEPLVRNEPPQPAPLGDWECVFCKFRDKCPKVFINYV